MDYDIFQSGEVLPAILDFYRGNKGLMEAVAARCTGLGSDHIEDIVQISMMRAVQYAGRFRRGNSGLLKSWMCRIVHNAAVSYHRSLWYQAKVGSSQLEPFDYDLVPDWHNLEQEVLTRDYARAVVRICAAELSDEYYSALSMVSEEKSYKEIADELQCPIGTVMSRVSRARNKIQTSSSCMAL